MALNSSNSISRESALEQITQDCMHLFGERGNLTRSLVHKLSDVWVRLSPEKAVRRFPEWQGRTSDAVRAIARHYVRQGFVESAAAYLSQKHFLFRFWAAEVHVGFERLADQSVGHPIEDVLLSSEYKRLLQMIDLIEEAWSAGGRDKQAQETADAGMFYANLAWFHFLWKRLFDSTDEELQQLITVPMQNMHQSLSGGRNHRIAHPYALQYPDARDMLLILEWLTLNRFTSLDQYGLDWPDQDGKFHHTLSLDRWVFQQWVDLAFDELPDELMLKTLRQFQSGPILSLATNHARTSVLCRRLGHLDEAERDLSTGRKLLDAAGECSVKEKICALSWFARADENSSDLEQATRLAIRASYRESGYSTVRLCSPIIRAIFETERWQEVQSHLPGSVVVQLAKAIDSCVHRSCPVSVWTNRRDLIESRRQQVVDFLAPHHKARTNEPDRVQRQFDAMLNRGDWQAASELHLDLLGPYQGPKAIVECCVAVDGLTAAIEWAEQIEDFMERQFAKLAAVAVGLDELKTTSLDTRHLSFGTLEWPIYGC